jgi:glycosyltransferase involved in cell wall biosynthesis
MIQIDARKTIKIVRILARLNIGGPAIHVVNLTAGLNPERFQSLLVTGVENPDEGSMLDYALSRGIQPLILPEIVNEFRLKPRDGKALLHLYQLMRRERPHIVHTHTAKAGFLGRLAARLAGVPLIVHTYHGHVLHGYYGATKNYLLRRMERALACITDQIITVSELVKRDLIYYRVAAAEKIAVLQLGFDLAPFRSCQNQRGHLRREYGLDEHSQLVGIVGRIVPVKNHRLFLDAAARVAAREESVRFVIVGDGALRREMEDYASVIGLAGRTIFTGWRRDLPKIYADLNVLVVSSDNEGTPVSAIEAMAAGLPVVATRVGGLPDLVTDGENGLLTPAKNPDAMATAILGLLQDSPSATRLGQTARTMTQERFAVERLVADTERLYLQLLVEKGLCESEAARQFATQLALSRY